MRQKIFVLSFLFLIIGMGFFNSVNALAEEMPTPAPTETPAGTPTPEPTEEPEPPVTVKDIQVIDSLVNVPYLYIMKKEDITLLVNYSDGTSDLVHPDAITDVDTSVIGETMMKISFGEKDVIYPLTVVPRKVSNLSMKEGTKTSMKIGWMAQEEAGDFQIFTSVKKDGIYKLKKTTTNSYYTFEDMTPGTIIYVKVKAIAGDYEGEESESIAIAPTPDGVQNVTAAVSTQTSVEIEWTRAEGATGYAIYFREASSDKYYYSGMTTLLSYIVTGLSAGKDYYFVVYAFGANISNSSEVSPECFYGTLPGTPTITKIKGGDRRIKVYWSKAVGATSYRIYASTKVDSGFRLWVTVYPDEYLLRNLLMQLQNKRYYVKIEAVRVVAGRELITTCSVRSAKTKKAKVTSTKAKYYKSKKAFKNSKAYKKNKAFRKKVSYKKSIVIPGLAVTNVAGFNTTKMVPQGVTVAGKYMLVTAYDKSKKTESVIYVIKRSNGKLRTTVVMPYMSHLGGIAYDGVNLWVTNGKKLHSIPFGPIRQAADRKQQFYEVYKINSICQMPATASYVTYYKGMIWCGTYNQYSKKYMYGFQINDKAGKPTLTVKHRLLMPNRTQGVTFTSNGKMIVSRSCQTKKGKSGYISRLDTYKPTWNMNNYTLKKNKCKKQVKVPSMNEGIVVCGKYTYVVYESGAFSSCPQHLDRITAFKTSKIC